MMRTVFTAALLLAGLAFAACGSGSSSNPTPVPSSAAVPSAAAGTPTALPTALPGEAPMPQHVSFAPGETIAADGKAGVFFLDPYTGAAEGWVVPAAAVQGQQGGTNFSFTIGGVSADGSKIVYECQQYVGNNLASCGNDPSAHEWYLFDTKTGSRTRLSAFTGAFLTISPDGRTLFGATPDRWVVATASDPQSLRTAAIDVPLMDAQPPTVAWSPDSVRLLVRKSDGLTWMVQSGSAVVADFGVLTSPVWSPDGKLLAAVDGQEGTASGTGGTLVMISADGQTVWSKAMRAFPIGWSADGRMLLVDALDDHRTAVREDDTERADVLDPATGSTLVRAEGIACVQGWLGDSHRFFTETLSTGTWGEAVVDADAATLNQVQRQAQSRLQTVPFDAGMLIEFNGTDFYALTPADGQERLIAKTTVTPAWDFLHQPLYAGKRIMFAPLHLGHGGCGEEGPSTIPEVRVLHGPFADDAAVTRGS